MEVVPIRYLLTPDSVPAVPVSTEKTTEDFVSFYIRHNSRGETPLVYNRWCAFSILGAMLGRQAWVEHEDFIIYPNMYTMLIGTPGARKSTAVKSAIKLLKATGYNTFSAERSTKEKFLLDLAGEDNGSGIGASGTIDDILDKNIFGSAGEFDGTEIREMYIAADEFNDFIGNGNVEFVSLLGSLWDFTGAYDNRIKNGKSVKIPNPTISILGGNTATGFALAFPPEILGQGFFSRLLVIYGEPNGRRIAFPKKRDGAEFAGLVEQLRRIKSTIKGPITFTPAAATFAEHVYEADQRIADPRFIYFSNRRFTHLLKLCGIISASRCSNSITEQDVLAANTYLTYAEGFMPKALGEFGKNKNSDVNHKILQILESETKVFSILEIWAQIQSDLQKIPELAEILTGMEAAGKIQKVTGKTGIGWLPNKKVVEAPPDGLVDFTLLSEEELNMRR